MGNLVFKIRLLLSPWGFGTYLGLPGSKHGFRILGFMIPWGDWYLDYIFPYTNIGIKDEDTPLSLLRRLRNI